MQKSIDFSVVIESNNEISKLPLAFMDLDNFFTRNNLTYEIIVLAKGESAIREANLNIKKFQKAAKYAVFRAVDPSPSQVSHLDINGSYGYFIRTLSIPVAASLQTLLLALQNEDKMQAHELVFGAYGADSIGGKMINMLCRLIGLPVRLDVEHLIVGFNRSVAPSVLNLRRLGAENFDIELALISRRLGYKIKEAKLFFRADEPAAASFRNRFNLLISAIRLKLAIHMDYQEKRANTF